MTKQKTRENSTLFPGNLPLDQGVFMGSPELNENGFEKSYLSIREKENRVFSDEIVAQLPGLKNHRHSDEWVLRGRSANRVVKYFQNCNQKKLLDIGCGNGWFSNLLSRNRNLEVFGVDVNKTELEQAASVFKSANLSFIYADLFRANLPLVYFDFVTFNASVQYFPDLSDLLQRLFEILKPGGEVHLIDTPFYRKDEIEAAQKRTIKYYSILGFPEMAQNYFHRCWDELKPYSFEVLYRPSQNKLKKVFRKKDIPFPWIKIEKQNGSKA